VTICTIIACGYLHQDFKWPIVHQEILAISSKTARGHLNQNIWWPFEPEILSDHFYNPKLCGSLNQQHLVFSWTWNFWWPFEPERFCAHLDPKHVVAIWTPNLWWPLGPKTSSGHLNPKSPAFFHPKTYTGHLSPHFCSHLDLEQLVALEPKLLGGHLNPNFWWPFEVNTCMLPVCSGNLYTKWLLVI